MEHKQSRKLRWRRESLGVRALRPPPNFAGIAQLVERLPCKEDVAGSNPCCWHHSQPPVSSGRRGFFISTPHQ